MEASLPLDAWLPSKLTLYAGKHKRALLVVKIKYPFEAGTHVTLLARRAGDDLVIHVQGTVSKARSNYVEIRIPWDAAATLAAFAGKKIDAGKPEDGNKIVVHDYVVQFKRWRPPLRQ
jgi:hypothetical protein